MQIVELLMTMTAAAVLMILHEFPKAFYFCITSENKMSQKWWKKVFLFHRYIDPIGIVLATVSFAGFSRPLMFRVENQKKNLRMGLLGFICLFCIFIVSVGVLKYNYGICSLSITVKGISAVAVELFWIYMTILSVSMFFVNLFPISVFDMGLCIAGVSSKHYLGIIKSDMLIKMILMLAIAVGVIRYFALETVKMILAFPI